MNKEKTELFDIGALRHVVKSWITYLVISFIGIAWFMAGTLGKET